MKKQRAHAWLVLAVIPLVLLYACTSQTVSSNSGPRVYLNAPWVLLPSINNTETPQAGGRLDSIAVSLMRSQGVNLSIYSVSSQQDDGQFESADRRSQEAALAWAKKQGYRYAVAGSVDEWHYKVGLDGEPAAGVSLSIIDVATGQALWSGSAAGTGRSQQAISALTQELVNKLLQDALSHATTAEKK
jgi:hypothetical protein